MGNKRNPLLASFEAKLEEQYRKRLEVNHEIDLITHLISCNEDLNVGPGRAEKVLNGFLETKNEIMDAVLGDDDKELLHTKYILATRLKQVMGADLWNQYKHFFPLLQAYWED